MKLNDFLHFNHKCPVCEGELTLYLQIFNNPPFKGQKYRNTWIFNPHKGASNKGIYEQQCITLFDYGTTYDFKFSSSDLASLIQSNDFCLFFLCNENGLSSSNEEIIVEDGCYCRASVSLTITKLNNSWIVKATEENEDHFIHEYECFCFIYPAKEHEQFFYLDFNYIENTTEFVHYSLNKDQRSNKNYMPIMFKKTLPLLSIRPNFSLENRDKLLQRLQSWITIT